MAYDVKKRRWFRYMLKGRVARLRREEKAHEEAHQAAVEADRAELDALLRDHPERAAFLGEIGKDANG